MATSAVCYRQRRREDASSAVYEKEEEALVAAAKTLEDNKGMGLALVAALGRLRALGEALRDHFAASGGENSAAPSFRYVTLEARFLGVDGTQEVFATRQQALEAALGNSTLWGQKAPAEKPGTEPADGAARPATAQWEPQGA